MHNESTHTARRTRLVSTEGTENWNFKGSLPDTVAADTRQKWSFSVQYSEEREKVIALCGQEALQRHELATAFLPHVVGHAEIVIAYDNDKDTTFYTRLIIDGDLQRSTLHWRKPGLTIDDK